ncbi:MAG TPA: UDP-3-O-(3-hydroxymyristoyl)glucosamine N-acyltransferase [Terriglobales bacterium]|nr:UDP-3-O-(3-hydroxymyristoyl)glucosamine N-acyltransferase [Terriglobales bacterium]
MKLSAIAQQLNVRLDGPDADVHRVIGIEEAQPGDLTFIANPKYASMAKTTRASAVFVDEQLSGLPTATTAALRTKNPYLAFARAIELFYQSPKYAPGVHSTAFIDPTAKIGMRAHIGAYAVIGPDVIIGDDAVILPHVVIYSGVRIGHRFTAHAHAVVREHVRIGDDVILQNGVVVGADGFGFAKDNDGRWYKIVQSGTTVLGNNVEVQANATIDRASIGETTIADNAKIDNLVQVGHGSKVGERTLLCAQVGLAGSTEVGNDVILAGQVGVAGHCRIGDKVIATAQSGIPNDVPDGTMVSGYPAIENRQWLRSVAIFNRLPELIKELRKKS